MNLSATPSHRSAIKGIVAAILSLVYIVRYCRCSVNPPVFALCSYGNHNPLSQLPAEGRGWPRSGPAYPRPASLPARVGILHDEGRTSLTRRLRLRLLGGVFARRPQAAELWGGVTYYAAYRPRAPQRGPHSGSYTAGGVPPRAGRKAGQAQACPRRRRRGKGGLWPLVLTLAAIAGRCGKGGGVPVTAVGWAEKLLRHRRPDAAAAPTPARRWRLHGWARWGRNRLGPYLCVPRRRPRSAAEHGTTRSRRGPAAYGRRLHGGFCLLRWLEASARAPSPARLGATSQRAGTQ